MPAWHHLETDACAKLGRLMQDDLLYESLTVYETLSYAAMLRLPQHMDHTAKTDRVDTVITALGLVSCKDTIIGEFSADTIQHDCTCFLVCQSTPSASKACMMFRICS